MATINLATVLDQNNGTQLIREYLDKSFLARRDWVTPLVNNAYAQSKPLPKQQGQWTEYTRKGRIRRPEHMATPSGAGSDPACGASLGTNKVLVPIEFMHEYCEIATVGQLTSWIDLEAWVEEDMPFALRRRMNELVQNAFIVGRMANFTYASDGTVASGVDQTAEATVTLYGTSFTFQSAPKMYANGKASFAQLTTSDTLKWSDLRTAHTRLRLAGALPVMGDKYMAVISPAQANDLLADTDGGKLTAVISSGVFKQAISGLESNTIFSYAGFVFVVDEGAFTENTGAGSEGKRANFGAIHSALLFGKEAYGYMPLGSAGSSFAKPAFKVQDVTKTGYSKTIGYMVPWQVAIINPDWCMVLKSAVSESKPNNYDDANPAKQLEGFSNLV